MKILINNIYILPILICAIFSLRIFRLNWPITYKIFATFVFTALFTEVTARSYVYYMYSKGASMKELSNYWIYTPMIIIQYLLCATVYYRAIVSHKLKKIIRLLMILFALLSIMNLFLGQRLHSISTYTHLFSDAMILFCVFSYFEQIRKDVSTTNISTTPLLWISIGLLIFHLVNVPYLAVMNYLVEDYKAIAKAFFYFHHGVIAISYIFFTKAFLCPTPQK
jgi:hypothetical protein